MNQKNIILSFAFFSLIASSAMLSGCGKTEAITSESASSQTGQGATDTSNPDAAWNNLEFKGYDNGQMLIYLEKDKQSIMLVLPFPFMSLPIIGLTPVPQTEGIELVSVSQTDGTKALGVRIPLRYIIKGAAFGPAKLPNGDVLPGVPAGELPAIALDLPNMNSVKLHIYFGAESAAVFAELPISFTLPINFDLGPFWLKNSAGTKTVGVLSYVLPKNTFKGGPFLAVNLPSEIARIIDDHIRLKQN